MDAANGGKYAYGAEMGLTVDVNMPESMTPWLRGETQDNPPCSTVEKLTVGEVASLVGVSVRTLHHWDAKGLVSPRERTGKGYRAYSAVDVERIHQVLVYRELGFSLARITAFLDDPVVNQVEQLQQQRELLEARIGRMTRMVDALDELLASRRAGATLTGQQQAEIFGQGWANESHKRGSGSDEWAQSSTLTLTSRKAQRCVHGNCDDGK